MPLILSPYRDLSRISEAKFLVSGERTRRTSLCLRGGATLTGLSDALEVAAYLAREVAARMRAGTVIVQTILEEGGRVSLCDVNPGLEPREIDLSTSRGRRRSGAASTAPGT